MKQAEIAQARTRWLQRRSYGVLALIVAATLAAVWQVYGFWRLVMLNRSEFIASQALDQFNIGHDRVVMFGSVGFDAIAGVSLSRMADAWYLEGGGWPRTPGC